MKGMDAEKKSIAKIEKKVWQLVLLAVVVVLYLTLSILALQFYSFLGTPDSLLFSQDSYKFSICLSVLVLLYCIYMILSQRKLMQTTRALFAHQETGRRLNREANILKALMTLSSRINEQMNLAAILNTITKEILILLEADHASIMLYDKASNRLKTMSSVGKGAGYAKDALIPMGKSIAGHVLKSGKPLLLHGQVDPEAFPGTASKARRISSSICTPLKIGKKGIGVLNVNMVEKDRRFSDSDLNVIAIFASNAAVAIHNSMLHKDRKERIYLQALFEQLHTPAVVRQLVKRSDSGNEPAEMRKRYEVAVFFADIRGFSNMMNEVALEDVMDFLDAFYSTSAGFVYESEGILDKFIGDEVMAFFGAPNLLANPSVNALAAARKIVSAFETLREKFSGRSPQFRKLGIGVGINTGEVFVGSVGLKNRYDYTVIGSAVNLSRRLCSHAAAGQILISEKTRNQIYGENRFEFTEKVKLKGMPDTVKVFGMAA